MFGFAVQPGMTSDLAIGGGGGGGSYDADAQTWFDNIVSAGSSISDTNKTAASTFFAGCKSDGNFSKMGCFYLFAGPDGLAGSLTRAKGPAGTAYNFVSGNFDRTTGLLGVNANQTYIDTNYPANSMGANDHHLAAYSTLAVFANNRALVSAGNASGATGVSMEYRGTPAFRTRSCSTTLTDTVVTAAAGWRSMRRDNGSNYEFNFNGVLTTVTDSSGSIGSENCFIFAKNATGSPTAYCADRLAFTSVGNGVGIDNVALRSRVLDYLAALV